MSLSVAILTIDKREHDRNYAGAAPSFGTAPEALLQGFAQLPELEVHVVSCTQQPVRAPEKIASNIFFHSLLVPKTGWMRTLYQGCIRATRRKLHEIRPDIVHGQGTERDCAISAAFSGFPNVLTIHGNMRLIAKVEHARPFSFWWLAARLETLTVPRSQGVVCITNYTRDAVADLAKKTWIVPNAVDTTLFRPGPRNQALAEQYGIGRDEVVVGYISSFQPYEDFATLVDAIAILRARGRRVRGLLVGDGSTRPDILRQVAELDLEGVVAMPGRIPHADVPRHHRLIDVFVVPRVASRLSQLVTPLKPLEAMASGRALVVSRLDALTETITDGQTGMTFDPGSATDLASVLERLVLDPGERHRLGDAARSWVERERTLARNGQRYREIYARLGVPLG